MLGFSPPQALRIELGFSSFPYKYFSTLSRLLRPWPNVSTEKQETTAETHRESLEIQRIKTLGMKWSPGHSLLAQEHGQSCLVKSHLAQLVGSEDVVLYCQQQLGWEPECFFRWNSRHWPP